MAAITPRSATSPLTQIDASSVAGLGLAWCDDLDTYRGVEATPIYAGGVLYNILPFNVTIAYDARTGERLWTFDPQVRGARRDRALRRLATGRTPAAARAASGRSCAALTGRAG